MKNLMSNGYAQLLPFAVVCTMTLSFLLGAASSGAAAPLFPAASPETLRLGEQVYREGVLPSGKPLLAAIKGGVSAPGTTFACISCHLRSGLGSVDEGIYTPAINGEKLFKPLPRLYKGIEQNAKSSPPLRPAYTEESLIEVLRSGRDAGGRLLSEAMPRYLIEDRDARILVAYLRSLSSQSSPGADATLRFATVMSEDIKPAESEAMLASFDHYFKMKKTQVRTFSNPRGLGAKSRLMAENMLGSRDLAVREMSLSHWTLKGPPETWRSQLEEYNRKEPVFALLGGIVSGPWKPVHQFSEENGIPCLFPNTDFPVISDTDLYTLYLSKGYYQEGEAAARYLNSRTDILEGRRVVQIVRASREAEALSAGFLQTWQELGQQAPLTVPLPSGNALDSDFLKQVLAKEKPAALVIWDDATALPALDLLSRFEGRPTMVFLSTRYLGESIWTLQETIRDFTFLTYPYTFSPFAPRSTMGKQKVQDDLQQTLQQVDVPLKNEVEKIASLTNSLTQILTIMLMDLKGNYYRDNLLDVAGMMPDQQYPLYGRISLGTGQRYASKGCFIVQLSHGDNPELVKKSSWVIH
ncbi:MAG: amino acid ABC transporter substrate-binding protein [Geobacter sp.]|nr:MAG: amino acid ABC transporter substrate-binding protein [Geobacter sp.]